MGWCGIDSTRAALYYPWVKILDPITEGEIILPPSGFMAGIFARNEWTQCTRVVKNTLVSVDVTDGANPKLLDSMYTVEGIIPQTTSHPMILVVKRHGKSGSRVAVIRV